MNRRGNNRPNRGTRPQAKLVEYNPNPPKETSHSVERKNYTKLLLFPGEEYEFNEKLIHYGAFGYSNGNLISKQCGLLLCNKEGKPIDETEQVFRAVGKYYSPKVDDFVIGTIVQKSSEFYKVDIGTYTYAILNTKDFEGATKKTKPNLHIGDSVFSRVLKVNKFDAPSLSCVSTFSTKNWASGESFFGGLKGGCVFDFPKMFAWELVKGTYAAKRIEDFVKFDICIGSNGRMWINSDKNENILAINDTIQFSFRHTDQECEKFIHDKFINQLNQMEVDN